MNFVQKFDACVFAGVWFLWMLYLGEEAYAAIAWNNVFLHCLGTVIVTAFVSAVLTGLLWCFYWIFKAAANGWGRLLVIPWIGISAWRYPHVLNQSWPETNPDPASTAAFFAALEGAGIVLFGMGVCSLFFLARDLKRFHNRPPAA